MNLENRIRYRLKVLFPLNTTYPLLSSDFVAMNNEFLMNSGRTVSG